MIFHTERKELSPDITLVWYWFDRSHELPGYRQGTDENCPSVGTYLNGKLISTVFWNKPTVTLEMVNGFLDIASDHQKMPGVHHLPEVL